MFNTFGADFLQPGFDGLVKGRGYANVEAPANKGEAEGLAG